MDEEIAPSSHIIAFATLLVIGCILIPSLTVFYYFSGLYWELTAFLTIICLLLSLAISKRLEKKKRIQKIRDGVKSKTKWMSLADFGASYGRLGKRGKKQVQEQEDRWNYLREVLSNSKNQRSVRSNRNR